jgi:threonine/homoserine/homoserine lactone efflux protein
MAQPETLLLFALTAFLLIAIPGPSTLYLLARTLSEGRRSGFASAFGVETGDVIHVGTAAIGLSALVASSALAFSVVKYAGAAYLVYLGLRAFRGHLDVDASGTGKAGSWVKGVKTTFTQAAAL